MKLTNLKQVNKALADQYECALKEDSPLSYIGLDGNPYNIYPDEGGSISLVDAKTGKIVIYQTGEMVWNFLYGLTQEPTSRISLGEWLPMKAFFAGTLLETSDGKFGIITQAMDFCVAGTGKIVPLKKNQISRVVISVDY